MFNHLCINGPPAVVVGLSVTGLGIVRSLARSGINVIGVDSNFDKPSAHTRYCEKVNCANIDEEKELLDTLIAIGRKSESKPVLFLSTDMSVLIASERRKILRDYYLFNLPSKSTVQMLMDKTLFAEFAKENGFQIPHTFVVNNHQETQSAAARVNYPCIIKPAFRKPIWDKTMPMKVFKALSKEELTNFYGKHSSLATRFIIQELIPGPDSEVYFCLLCYDALSQPIASFTGRKLMQWVPELGSTCIAESCSNNIVLNESIRLFDVVKYKGIGSVEFKRDPRDDVFKIVEPTVGRQDLQSEMAYHCGINIPLLEYSNCLGLQTHAFREKKRMIYWINEENLFWLLGNERHRYPLKIWIRLIMRKRCYALFDISDIAPFFQFLRRISQSIFNRFKRESKKQKMHH